MGKSQSRLKRREAKPSKAEQELQDAALGLLPRRCGLKCCDNYGMVVKPLLEAGNKEGLLPLQAVTINVKIEAGFATVDLELVYINPSTDCALEATYEFPLEKTTLLSKLFAELNG